MTTRIFRIVIFVACLVAPVAVSAQSGATVLNARAVEGSAKETIPEAWPAGVQINRLADIGRGKAVIFSPDFAGSGNRAFYEKLGFFYVEEASWQKALNQVIARNYWHPEDRIESIFLETHGTNGNGLKLQTGAALDAPRSYISVGALLEKLDGLGVRLCVIGACNAGRLLRPDVYKTLNPRSGDRLFLPATKGIFNASPNYDPAKSGIIVVRRAESEIETTTDGNTSELSELARSLLGLDAGDQNRRFTNLHFVASNLLIQMLIRDPRLKLTASGYANTKSSRELSNAESDALFERFLSFVNQIAEREYQITQGRSPAAIRLASGAQPIVRSSGSGKHKSAASETRSKKLRTRRVID